MSPMFQHTMTHKTLAAQQKGVQQ